MTHKDILFPTRERYVFDLCEKAWYYGFKVYCIMQTNRNLQSGFELRIIYISGGNDGNRKSIGADCEIL